MINILQARFSWVKPEVTGRRRERHHQNSYRIVLIQPGKPNRALAVLFL